MVNNTDFLKKAAGSNIFDTSGEKHHLRHRDTLAHSPLSIALTPSPNPPISWPHACVKFRKVEVFEVVILSLGQSGRHRDCIEWR